MFRRLEGLPLRGDVPSPAQERTPVTPFVTDGIDGDAVRSTRTPSVEQVLAEIAQKSNDRIRPLLKRGVEVGALRRRKLTERLQLARARLVAALRVISPRFLMREPCEIVLFEPPTRVPKMAFRWAGHPP